MTRAALHVTALLAMGVLVASSPVVAQEASTPTSGGQVTVSALGVNNIASSEVSEYREVPKGIAIPFANLFATGANYDVNLFGYNVRQKDQRYNGWLQSGFAKLSFDYNQIIQNKGNDARTIFSEVSEGVWGINTTLRTTLGSTIDATPTAGRTLAFYKALLEPTFAATNSVDISSLRKRGVVELDLGANLPFDLVVSYMREARNGYRGVSGEDILGNVSPVVALPEPLNDVTQDFGVRAAYNFAMGNIHAAVNRNLFNNRAETFVFDNPFQPVDKVYTAAVGTTPALGGPSRARIILAPDNEATTASGGFLLKFARQTRLAGDLALGRWTQNADFYPHTINSTILTPSGVRADSVQALQQASLDGKINTTTMNFMFSSRPVDGLGLRASYRVYELANKTNKYVNTGDVSGSPDRSWGNVTPSADAPYGHVTANLYDTTTKKFAASASYDFGPVSLEGHVRHTAIERTWREAAEGTDKGYALTAMFDAKDWLGFRGTFDSAKRTAEGHTVYGFQADESERETQRLILDVELTPMSTLGFLFSYQRRDVDFTNRPDRVQVTSGAPTPGAAPIPNTPSGLLEASYDSYTGEIDFTPSERIELSAFYTYEKDSSTNQWATTTGAALNNLLNYKGTDETDTYGAHAMFQLVPEKVSCTLLAQRQKTDGLMDVTANPTGAFSVSRSTVGGAQDINAYDDTKFTTIQAQLDYTIAKQWTLGLGYWYEKYEFDDAYTSGTDLLPQSVLIFMKANDGNYNAKIIYAKLNYKF